MTEEVIVELRAFLESTASEGAEVVGPQTHGDYLRYRISHPDGKITRLSFRLEDLEPRDRFTALLKYAAERDVANYKGNCRVMPAMIMPNPLEWSGFHNVGGLS